MDRTVWIIALVGAAAGLLTLVLSKYLLEKRQPGLDQPWWIKLNLPNITLWGIFGVLLMTLATYQSDSTLQTAVRAIWFFSLLSLSLIDQTIRKIPNEALALMIIAKVLDLVIHWDLYRLLQAVVGLVVGYIFFSIPAYMGRAIGKGDVKLAAVISFCIGIYGMLQSVLIMSLGIVIVYLVKLKYKHGSLKTKVAIGPYLSLGMVISVLFPLLFP